MNAACSTVPPRPLCGTCHEYPVADGCEGCGLCALAEINGEPPREKATVRPPVGPCGRIHIEGFECPTCAVPWLDWPTHAGWWWHHADGYEPDLVLVNEDLGLAEYGSDSLYRRDERGADWRFLDARLTPPAPPEGR